MPESFTKNSRYFPFFSYPNSIEPTLVNLMAFLIRFIRIPYTFSLSVLMMASFVGKPFLNKNRNPLISTSGLKNL